MSVYGTNMQKRAYDYFDLDSISYKKAGMIPENIIELEKLVEQTHEDIIFMNALFDEIEKDCDVVKEWILSEIDNYENNSNEMMLFEKSKYSIIYIDKYYLETAECNHRNWIYPIEVYNEIRRLEDFISKLNLKLKEKIVNIGLEITMLIV